MGRYCDVTETGMELDDQLPELKLSEFKKVKELTPEVEESVEKEEDSVVQGSVWPEYEFSWQDFVPEVFSRLFLINPTDIPSFLSLVSDVSDFLPDGALFFNFVFDWWFTEPLHPDEDSVKVVELKYPCTKCDLKFQFDWEVPKHYLETHLAAAPQKPTPEPVKQPEPKPEPVRAETPEVYVEPYPPLEDWCWQDFLPDWSQYFLPSVDYEEYDNSDIEDDDPDPEPVVEEREPTPKPEQVAPAVIIPPAPIVPRRQSPTPVIKQSKFQCRTCDKTICNSCFTKKCGAHNVEFKGTAKFACASC